MKQSALYFSETVEMRTNLPIHFLLLGQTDPLNLFPVHTYFYVMWPIGAMGKSDESFYYSLVCFQRTDQSFRPSVALA